MFAAKRRKSGLSFKFSHLAGASAQIMHALVLNLTRFGDLLQTQPVIAGLKAQGREASLICLENFALAAELLHGPSEIFALPAAGLLADLDLSWPKSLHRLHDWRSQIQGTQDASDVFNLTPTQSARLLTRVLSRTSSKQSVAGFGLDEQGFGFYGNAWAAFLQMSSTHRGCSPFNLVDLMLRCSGLPATGAPLALKRPGRSVLETARAVLQAQEPAECAGYVAFQLGASEPRRQWPEAYFADLGDLLWKNLRFCPVLLGTRGERELAEKYARLSVAPSIDLVGRTSLSELAAVLCQARLLVTNDTGTMHLAAGLDRPIAAIFLATAQPWDTGPFREGCLCLEPDLDCHPCAFGRPCVHDQACRRAISPKAVYDLLVEHFFPDAAVEKVPERFTSGIRSWRTAWDRHGFMNLIALSGQETSVRTQWIRIQRHYYRQFLDQALELLPYADPWHLPLAVEQRIVGSLEQSQALLQVLDSQARVLAKTPMTKIKQKFLAYWERLQSHWQEDPFFSVLGRLWLVESQDSGTDASGILDLTRRYRELVCAWRSMFSKIS